jgi:hypothetical protein
MVTFVHSLMTTGCNMTRTTDTIKAPSLDHDAMMKKRFGQEVSAVGRRERRIVANLIAHMERAGWKVQGVHDGDGFDKAADMKAAMELIFNLDLARLYFEKGAEDHGVLLVLGNDMDIISDWTYSDNDSDGFNAAMEAFDVEQFA